MLEHVSVIRCDTCGCTIKSPLEEVISGGRDHYEFDFDLRTPAIFHPTFQEVDVNDRIVFGYKGYGQKQNYDFCSKLCLGNFILRFMDYLTSNRCPYESEHVFNERLREADNY